MHLSSRPFVARGMNLPFAPGTQPIDGEVAKPRRIGRNVDVVAVIDVGFGPAIGTPTRHSSSGTRLLLAVVVMCGLRHCPRSDDASVLSCRRSHGDDCPKH